LNSIGAWTAASSITATANQCLEVPQCNTIENSKNYYANQYGILYDCQSTGSPYPSSYKSTYGTKYSSVDSVGYYWQPICPWAVDWLNSPTTGPYGYTSPACYVPSSATSYCDYDLAGAYYSSFSISSTSWTSSCVNQPDCSFNGAIANTRYYTHAIAPSSYYPWTITNTYNSGLITNICLTSYSANSIRGYVGPTAEKRQLQITTTGVANNRNVPLDFLFVEDYISTTSLSAVNPIKDCYFDNSWSQFNTFKLQLQGISASYDPAPVGDDDDETSSFTIQTWNLLFLEENDDMDAVMDTTGIVFEDVSISTTSGNQINVNDGTVDYEVLDLYWHVYYNAATNQITEDLTTDPSVSGFDNLVIFSTTDMDGSMPVSLHDQYIFWTTYYYYYTTTNVYTVPTSTSVFPNVFQLYGISLGETTTANTIILFFSTIMPLTSNYQNDIWGAQGVSCDSQGITVTDCQYISVGSQYSSASYNLSISGLSSTFLTGSISNMLYRSRLEITYSGTEDDSWSIVFPYTTTSGVSESLLIGLQNSNGILTDLSGIPNNQQFGLYTYSGLNSANSAGTNTLYSTISTATSIAALYLSQNNVIAITTGSSTNRPSTIAYSWVNLGTGYETGDVASNVQLNAALTYTSVINGYYPGVMLCASDNYRSDSFAIDYSSSTPTVQATYPNWFGCWETVDYAGRYCSLCNLYGLASTTTFTVAIDGFQIPDDNGNSFPSDFVTVLFNQNGLATYVTPGNYYTAPWTANLIELTNNQYNLVRGQGSQRLSLAISW
jgi:hypothetical protein